MAQAKTAKKFVYSFGGGKADGNESMKNLLGGKGANLAEMAGHPNFVYRSRRVSRSQLMCVLIITQIKRNIHRYCKHRYRKHWLL